MAAFENGVDNFNTAQVASMEFVDLPQNRQKQSSGSNLDSGQMRNLHGRLWDYFRQELDRQGNNRYQQTIDADYYDHLQWTDEQLREMEERGQAPRVYNRVKPTVDWILGTEKRTRVDWKILPRTQNDTNSAEAKTDLMKYVSDANSGAWVMSTAFADAVKVGIGWVEAQYMDQGDGEPLYIGYESWRNMLWDSVCLRNDIDDARFVFRQKWMDADMALAMFPKRFEIIKRAVLSSERYGPALFDADEAMDSVEFMPAHYTTAYANIWNKRTRVRLIEAWYKVPRRAWMLTGTLRGEIYDSHNPIHTGSVNDGSSAVVQRPYMQMRMAVMTASGLLWEGPSPYKHNKFPFTPIFAYKRSRDNMPYGSIRGVRDPQDDLNKRISKALHIMSTNKIVMEEGAVEDIDEMMVEASRPDGVIILKAGNKRFDMNADRGLDDAHLRFVEMDEKMIQDIGGVTDENQGRGPDGMSGYAITARQKQGSVLTAELFDNLLFAHKIHGAKVLALIEQYYTEQKVIRLTDARGQVNFRTLNDGTPGNQIDADRCDFIVSEQDFHESQRQAAVDQMIELAKMMPPEMVPALADLIVENMDVPNQEEILNRIRSITGYVDPNAKLTPEQQQQIQQNQQAKGQQQQLQEKLQALQMALLQAQVEKLAADTGKAQADTMASQAKALDTGASAVEKRVATAYAATQAGAVIAGTPGVAPIADTILKEAGWTDNMGTDPQLPYGPDGAPPNIDPNAPQGQAQPPGPGIPDPGTPNPGNPQPGQPNPGQPNPGLPEAQMMAHASPRAPHDPSQMPPVTPGTGVAGANAGMNTARTTD